VLRAGFNAASLGELVKVGFRQPDVPAEPVERDALFLDQSTDEPHCGVQVLCRLRDGQVLLHDSSPLAGGVIGGCRTAVEW
jgi:hypothetical protein